MMVNQMDCHSRLTLSLPPPTHPPTHTPTHPRGRTCRRDSIVKLTTSSHRTVKQDEAVAAVTDVLTKAGVDVGGSCGVVLSSSQNHGVTPDRLNRDEHRGLTARSVTDSEYAAAWGPFETTRQLLVSPVPLADGLTPAEQHVVNNHPHWYAGVQLSMLVTNCATWHLGLHLPGTTATTVTVIRLNPGHARNLQVDVEVAMVVVATMAILLPARVVSRPGDPLPPPVHFPTDGSMAAAAHPASWQRCSDGHSK